MQQHGRENDHQPLSTSENKERCYTSTPPGTFMACWQLYFDCLI